MYARFFRWASDRVDENGVVALITNRSFIDGRTFDGFRKTVAEEFNDIYLIDLGGDVRADPRLSGTKHNVFGIQTGVAISLMVKRAKAKGCRIRYACRPQLETGDEKLGFLNGAKLETMTFQEIAPNARHDGLDLTSNDFDTLTPIADRDTKLAKAVLKEHAIFKLFSLGVVTNRDEWIYDETRENLLKKINFFAETFATEQRRWVEAGRPKEISDFVDRSIKWTSELETHLKNRTTLCIVKQNVVESMYRPFTKRFTYFAPVIKHRHYQNFSLFPDAAHPNVGLVFGFEKRTDFAVIGVAHVPNKDMFLPCSAKIVCQWRDDNNKQRIDNMTDWALKRFQAHLRSQWQPVEGGYQ